MLNRKATYFTPDLTLKNGVLHVVGRLWMENAPKYFEKVFEHTINAPSKEFKVVFDVDHLNSSSIKQLVSYFKLLKELKDNGKFTTIDFTWNISEDDKELKELVQDIENISDLKITIGKLKI